MTRRALLADETPPPPRRGNHHLGLVFPGSYAECSSSLGAHFLLGAVRSVPGCSAGRILPTSGDRKPATLEEGARAATLPVLLVSVPWELMVGPLVEILMGAGIPLLASDRDETHPVVVAGGALALSNPELLEPLADVVVRGDGEEALCTLLDLITHSTDRQTLVSTLDGLEGACSGTRATCPAEDLPARSAFLTPHAAWPSMHLVEVMRGCPHGCTFCVMSGSRTGTAPRYVPAKAVLAAVPEGIRRVGLVGPSVLEHPEIEGILEALGDRGLEASISSTRADRFDDRIASLLSGLGLRTLTVALDGASARIRKSIRKTVRARDVLGAARVAREHGIGRLKLYVMLGFEEETDEDVRELADTCLELASLTSLTLSCGPVVPKRSTPLETMHFVERRTYERRLRLLNRSLGSKARVDSVSWREARTEATLARMAAAEARDLYAGLDPSRPIDLVRDLRSRGTA